MRRQICVTLDEMTHSKIIRRLGKYKSKSKLIEHAIGKFLEGEDGR